MNIKLAEKVFKDDELRQFDGVWSVRESVGYYIRVGYHTPGQKLKLIEWLANNLQHHTKASDILEAIATNDTEKLVEIAESLLDKGECCE